MSCEIIGRAAVAPGADSVGRLLDLLRQRTCSVTEIPSDRWDKARYFHPEMGIRGKTYSFAAGLVDNCFAFDANLFSMSQPEVALLDPQQRMILQVAWSALEDAAIDFVDLKDQRVGVYVGASSLDHGNLVVEDPARAGPHFMTGNTLSIVSNRISHVFGLNGPSMTVDTACSSSLVALDIALKALEAGEIDLAIVGGVNALTHPLPFVGFAQARMLSPDGLCRSYDDDGAGYVRAEGCAVVVLRRTDAALGNGDRSHARILASGVNSSGRTNGISLPSAQAQAMLLRSLYEDGGIDPNRLAFIEGHGTGTRVGDPAEIWSIGTVIGRARRAPIPIGSIKSNIGHAEPASGLLGLIKAQLALANDFVPATLHFDKPNQTIDFDGLNVHVASEPIELLHGKQPRLAGVNSFGFGGTNAHVILSDPEPRLERPPPVAAERPIFLASAQSRSALSTLLRDYRSSLKATPEAGREQVIAASGANRPLLRHRFVVANANPERVLGAIEALQNDMQSPRAETASALPEPGPIAFVFSGNGSQWAGMAVDAYQRDPAFRRRFDIVDALFEVHSAIVLKDLLVDPDLDRKLSDTRIAQPLLFACQAALSDVLIRRGIVPTAVFGHSVGEIAAGYVSGALALEDAVAVVAKRSFHQAGLAGLGKMAAVQLGVSAAESFCVRHGLESLHIAGDNGPDSVTLSGPADAIDALLTIAARERVAVQLLDIDYPFHHPLIDDAREAFLDDLTDLAVRPTKLPFVSTVTGFEIGGTALDAEYWWRNVRERVRFREATETAIDLGCRLFLEIGPRPILTSYLKGTIKAKSVDATPLASLTRGRSSGSRDEDFDPLARIVARVVAHGGKFDRRALFGGRDPDVVLPKLPFEAIDARHDFTSDAIDLYGRSAPSHTLAGWRVDPQAGHWKNHVDAHLYPDLAEHVVDGQSILPGSGFLEIALSAARQFFGTDDGVAVSNLQIMRPLVLSKTSLLEISTTISAESRDIAIRSRERLSDDPWTLNASGRLRKLAEAGSPAIPESRYPKSASVEGEPEPHVIETEEAYATARRFLLDYGPRFRLLKSARRNAPNTIEVELRAASVPAHPLLAYSLDPVSVDAAFHGLVALFEELSGDTDGAPFIPIRFGDVRLFAPGTSIARAKILLTRVSALSLAVEFRLYSGTGQLVADLADCRFRRTHLRAPKPLTALTLHQTVVPSAIDLVPRTPVGFPSPLFPPACEAQPDEAVQLEEAAVLRACQDIALSLVPDDRTDGRVSRSAIPHREPLRRHVLTCLAILMKSKMAERDGQDWIVETGSPLPDVGVILTTLLGEHPDRVGEVALINDLHRGTLAHLRDDAGDLPRPSASALAEIRERSRLSKRRSELLATALNNALESVAADDRQSARRVPGRMVELCAVSSEHTAAIARMAARAGRAFAVVEVRQGVRDELKRAFDGDPSIEIISPAELEETGAVDILFSQSESLAQLLKTDDPLRRAVKQTIGRGATLVAAAPGPSLLFDFALALQDDDPLAAPSSSGPGADEWRSIFEGMGFEDIRSTLHDFAEGPVVAIEVRGRVKKALPAEPDESLDSGKHLAPRRPVLVLEADGFETSCVRIKRLGSDGVASLPIVDHDASTAEQLGEILRRTGAEIDVVMIVGRCGSMSAAQRLQTGMTHLAAVAKALAAADPAAKTPPRLAVLLSSGAPAMYRQEKAGTVPDTFAVRGDDEDAISNAGLWTYLRVLRNEYANLEVHTIEAPKTGSPGDDDRRIASALSLLRSGSANREWVVDEASSRVAEVRVVAGPCAYGDRETIGYRAATIRQSVPSQITSIAWESTGLPEPGEGEVVIAVEATGLNFRDVMWSMGLLPEEALENGFAGATIGMECAGHVAAVGPGVDDLAVGDRVMAAATAAFSTHVRVARFAVAKIPDAIGIEAGATLPVAFLTAYYALVEIARLEAGESVLIHGGAGGVGLAALQIAKARKATVFATAGTGEKRRLLSMLGADHVFNSRDLGFVDAIETITRGEGVDVVLNSLFGEAMERSLGLVKPFGRFLELGKRDFYADSKIGLRPFRRNVSYFGIDLDQLLEGRPDVSRRLLDEVSAMFESGTLVPLPNRLFAYDEIVPAFRLMQSSGHIGKIVVTPPRPGKDPVLRAASPKIAASADGVHLVVGGIGGFGLAAAAWLVRRGARHLALATRRGVADEETRVAIADWAGKGVTVSLHACDVTDRAAVDDLLAGLRKTAPLRSVIHAAMVLEDGLIANATAEGDSRVIEAKAAAASHLDDATRDDRLEAFIMFSSATTLIGNPGQANYVAANGYLEGLARRRRAEGLHALAVQFGAITDAGYLAREARVTDILAKRIGATGMSSRRALELLGQVMAADPGTLEAAVVAIAEIDWTLASQLPVVASPLFSAAAEALKGQMGALDAGQVDLATMIAGRSPEDAQTMLFEVIAGGIATTLRVPVSEISKTRGLRDLGLDSLMAMEVSMDFRQKTGFDLPLANITQATSVGDMAAALYARLARIEATSPDSGEVERPDTAMIGELAARHRARAENRR